MRDWIAKNWKGVSGYIVIAMGGIVTGQFLPNYFDFVSSERGRVQAVVSSVSTSADAVENTIPQVISVAIGATGDMAALHEPIEDLNSKMLALFQALDYVSKEFPQIAPEREKYVSAVVELREAAAGLSDITTAPEFVVAASLFKDARTTYEQRVSDLEPSYVASILTSLR